MHDGYDQHAACRENLNKTIQHFCELAKVHRVEVEEGDQHGTWIRVAKIKEVIQTPYGLLIRVI